MWRVKESIHRSGMGRAPCCDESMGLKKGPWTPDEDQKLMDYIQRHGHGSWRSLPLQAGIHDSHPSKLLNGHNVGGLQEGGNILGVTDMNHPTEHYEEDDLFCSYPSSA